MHTEEPTCGLCGCQCTNVHTVIYLLLVVEEGAALSPGHFVRCHHITTVSTGRAPTLTGGFTAHYFWKNVSGVLLYITRLLPLLKLLRFPM